MSELLIYIYEIKCKDPLVTDNYIGQTECFDNRQYQHSRDSKISNLKLYKKIRENGGWDNWDMKILDHYYCKDTYESRQIEQKYIDIFNSTLNEKRAYSKTFINEDLDKKLEFYLTDYSDKILGCYLYDYYLDFEINIICEYCKIELKNNSSLIYHQKNTKYCLEIQGKKQDKFICEQCDKVLSSKQRLEHHQSICVKSKREINLEIISNEKEETIFKLKIENDNLKEQLQKQEEKYKEQLQKQEENHKEQIKVLQQIIERLIMRAIDKPTTTNNTTVI